MIRMTLLSFLGHTMAAMVLVFLSWYQPVPRIKRPGVQMLRFPGGSGVRPPGGGSVGITPAVQKKTPQTVSVTPPPSTPAPPKTPEVKKTIARQKKTPTPEPTKTATPAKKSSPTPKPTATPAKTKPATPAPSPSKTPKVTGAPGKATPSKTSAPDAAVTAKSGKTPGPDSTPAPLVIGAAKQGKNASDVGVPGLPGVPGGTGPPTPLSQFDYYRYMAQLKIERNFTVPRHLRSAEGVTCLIRFTVMRDGRIANIRILQGTNDPILDGLAQRALETTAQLGPLPDTIEANQVELSVIFEYFLPEGTGTP